jgi:selenophosphate synthase
VELGETPEDVAALGFDPQTSGGLLFTLSGEKGPVLAARFAAEGLFLARIGRVVAGSGVAVSVS